ncbi:hypothetical protein CRG98_002968 [Punica granatum]|uniref:MULE transposase domain-containing protein n=1 Tax=Punica granatum TaxID=22663 RepID=A0A2I0L7H1_PUNGR|nr:hypothetical protein CRG98_002968 [Punica granatum]
MTLDIHVRDMVEVGVHYGPVDVFAEANEVHDEFEGFDYDPSDEDETDDGLDDSDYARKLLMKNTVKVERNGPEGAVTFKRLYMGFEGLTYGFLPGCRQIITLDGCFLKTPLGGQFLSIVGKDEKNQMFLIARAVVKGNNESSWNWFLIRLCDCAHPNYILSRYACAHLCNTAWECPPSRGRTTDAREKKSPLAIL